MGRSDQNIGHGSAANGAGRWIAVALLAGVVLAGGVARLWKVGAPPTDFPADRQVNTALLVEAWSGGRPIEAFKFSHVSGSTDPRVLMPEAPIVPLLAAASARITSRAPERSFVFARLWTIAFSLVTLLLVFDLGRRWFGPWAGLLGAGAFAVLPASIYYGRAVIPDVPMAAFMAGAVWVTVGRRGVEGVRRWGVVVLVGVMVALAVLAKVYGCFVLAPLAVMLLFEGDGGSDNCKDNHEGAKDTKENGGSSCPSRLRGETLSGVVLDARARWLVFGAAVLGGVAALFAWYPISPLHPLRDFAAMSRGTNSVLGWFADYAGSSPCARVYLNRIDLTLTGGGAVLALLGAAVAAGRGRWGLLAWLATSLAFVYLVVGANTYWAYLLLPPACVCIGAALEALSRWVCSLGGGGVARNVVSVGLVLGAGMASLLFSPSLRKVHESYYVADGTVMSAGEFVRAHTKPDDVLVACGEVPFDLLWSSGRSGWSVPREDRAASAIMTSRPPHEVAWDMTAIARPGESQAFASMFALAHCVAWRSDVALFKRDDPSTGALAGVSDQLSDTIAASSRPVEFEGGPVLLGAGMLVDEGQRAAEKRTTVEMAFVWKGGVEKRRHLALPHQAQSEARLKSCLAMRLRSLDHPGLVLRLTPQSSGLNLWGEDFSRLQLWRVSRVYHGAIVPEDASAFVTAYSLTIPEHFPPGKWRIEIAVLGDDRTPFLPVVGGRGVWVGLLPLNIASRKATASISPSRLFPIDQPDGRVRPSDGPVTLTVNDSPLYLGPGKGSGAVTLHVSGRPAIASRLSLLATNPEARRWRPRPITGPGDLARNAPSVTFGGYGWSKPDATQIQVRPTTGGFFLVLGELPTVPEERRWPLYLNEVRRPPGSVTIESISVELDSTD